MAIKRISVREYDKLAEALLKRIQAEAKPFADSSDAVKEKRKARGQRDFLWFCKTYLPHHFQDDWDTHDKKLANQLKIWDELHLFEAFRGWGKSTKLIVGYGIYATVFKLTHYITLTSDTEEQAELLALPVRTELANNLRIQQDFGELRSHDWAEGDFSTRSGVKWKCFGWRSTYRGTRYLQYRPGIAFVDDIDNDENVKNPKQVKKRYEHITHTIVPAMGPRFQVILCGTKLARNCVVTHLEKNPEVVKFILPAERDEKPTSPGRFPKSRLAKLKRLIGTVAYSKEYLLKVVGDETRAFQDGWFVKIKRQAEDYKYITAFIDPSVGKGESNDYKAIVVVGWTGEFYDILYAWIRKTSIDHMIKKSYRIYEEWHPVFMGLETNGFQSLLKREYVRAASDEGYHLPIKSIVNTRNKENRILRLSPLVEKGLLRFLFGSGDMGLLVDQFLDFPDGNNDDGPDAAEGAIRLLEKLSGKTGEVDAEAF